MPSHPAPLAHGADMPRRLANTPPLAPARRHATDDATASPAPGSGTNPSDRPPSPRGRDRPRRRPRRRATVSLVEAYAGGLSVTFCHPVASWSLSVPWVRDSRFEEGQEQCLHNHGGTRIRTGVDRLIRSGEQVRALPSPSASPGQCGQPTSKSLSDKVSGSSATAAAARPTPQKRALPLAGRLRRFGQRRQELITDSAVAREVSAGSPAPRHTPSGVGRTTPRQHLVGDRERRTGRPS